MSNVASNLKLSAVAGALLVVPFMILELVNTGSFPKNFPVVLFAFIWLLSFAFIFTLSPIVRRMWAGSGIMSNPVSLLLRAVLLVPIAWLWISVVIDQMPCFLGVPNCD